MRVVPDYFVVFDGGGWGASAVVGGGRGAGWEVPFYVGCAGCKRDIVEVDELEGGRMVSW